MSPGPIHLLVMHPHLLLSPVLLAALLPAQGPQFGPVPRIFGWEVQGASTGSQLGSAIAVLERTQRGTPAVVTVDRVVDTVRWFDVRHGAEYAAVRGAARINLGRVLAAGDIDGDGHDDVAVGSDAGVTFLDAQGQQIFSHNTPVNGGVVHSLAMVDLNGDGFCDCVIGRAFGLSAQFQQVGAIDLLDGQTRTVVASVTGPQANSSFGWRSCAGELQGQPVVFVSAPNVTNQHGGTGEVRAFGRNLNPVFGFGPAGDRRTGSGFLAQRGNRLAIGSDNASLTPFSGEGNVAIVDLPTGTETHSFTGSQALGYLGNTGAFHPDGSLWFTAQGTQFEGICYRWDLTNPPVALFQGDPGTRVRLDAGIHTNLLRDGRPVGFLGQPGAANAAGRTQAGRIAPLLLSPQTLFAARYRVPAGGTSAIDVAFGPGFAGGNALVLASLSGVGPTPLPFGPTDRIALTLDGFTSSSPLLFGGVPKPLDGNGEGAFTMTLPNDPSLPATYLAVAAFAINGNQSAFGASADAHTLRVFD